MNKKGKPHFDNDRMIVVIILLIITNGNISKKIVTFNTRTARTQKSSIDCTAMGCSPKKFQTPPVSIIYVSQRPELYI